MGYPGGKIGYIKKKFVIGKKLKLFLKIQFFTYLVFYLVIYIYFLEIRELFPNTSSVSPAELVIR